MSPICASITIVLTILAFLGSGECGGLSFDEIKSSLVEKYRSIKESDILKLIFPGTLWCGDGDRSGGKYENLGSFNGTDNCCRQHDLCEDRIFSQETKYNLTNESSYTRSNCDCDFKFFDCLRNTCTEVSGLIAVVYFDVVRQKCFTNCTESKCQETINSTSAYEWSDGKRYSFDDAASHIKYCIEKRVDTAKPVVNHVVNHAKIGVETAYIHVKDGVESAYNLTKTGAETLYNRAETEVVDIGGRIGNKIEKSWNDVRSFWRTKFGK